MKQISTIISFVLLATINAYCCPVCESRQPKLLRGITHGAGPESNWDWVIIGIVSIITLYTAWFSLKYLCMPKENQYQQIKNSVIE